MTLYFVADLHLRHANILKFTDRPFTSLEAMEQQYIRTINIKVKDSDTLVLVGDICFGTKSHWKSFLDQLKCKNLILVVGNHDRNYPRDRFKSVVEYYAFKVGSRIVSVSHYPMRTKFKFKYLFKRKPRYFSRMLPYHGGVHVHGHTHSKDLLHDGNQVHIGVDATGGLPISIYEILNLIGSK